MISSVLGPGTCNPTQSLEPAGRALAADLDQDDASVLGQFEGDGVPGFQTQQVPHGLRYRHLPLGRDEVVPAIPLAQRAQAPK